MVDVHSHILYGIDDGCTTIEESIETLINLKNKGFNKIIVTPHFIEGSRYVADNALKKERFKQLKKIVEEKNLGIELYLGNEIYINANIHEHVMNREIYTLNKSRYILVELPLYSEINNVEDYLYELKLQGYIPVIAHPERYEYFQKDYNKAKRLYESGVLYQCNYASIIDKYGKDANKLLCYLLKNNMVTFMATDIHKPTFSLLDKFDEVKNKIINIVGEDKFNDISCNNAIKMLNDEEIKY